MDDASQIYEDAWKNLKDKCPYRPGEIMLQLALVIRLIVM
jgi:hypothetical protein